MMVAPEMLVDGIPVGCTLHNTFIERLEDQDEETPVRSWDGPDGLLVCTRTRAHSCPALCFPEPARGFVELRKDAGESCASTRGSEDGEHRYTPPAGGSEDTEAEADGTMESWRTARGSSKYSSMAPGATDGSSKRGIAKRGGAPTSTTLVLRGLPFNVTEDQVIDFVEQSGISWALAEEGADGNPVVHLLVNAQGRPSGFAEIRLARESDFWEARAGVHMKSLGGRYIEALPPRAPRRTRERGEKGGAGGGAGGGGGGRNAAKPWRRGV